MIPSVLGSDCGHLVLTTSSVASVAPSSTTAAISRDRLNGVAPWGPPPISLSIRTTAMPRPQSAAQPATRTSRAVMLVPTGPNQPRRRPAHGSAASAATPTRTRTRSVTTRGWAAEDACQLTRTAQAAVAATIPTPSQYTTLRIILASLAASHNPPASQPSRGHPAGT